MSIGKHSILHGEREAEMFAFCGRRTAQLTKFAEMICLALPEEAHVSVVMDLIKTIALPPPSACGAIFITKMSVDSN